MDLETLGEAFPRQLTRVSTVLSHYQACGVAGMFGAGWIAVLLQHAYAAYHAHDTIAMIRLYPQLLEVQD